MRLRKSVKVDLISRVPLFGGCSKKELGQIAAIADELNLPQGRTLIREGNRGHEFFVLVDGTARVTRHGRKLRDLGAGDWAGEIALVSNGPRTATVVTSSPVRLLVVTDRGFRELLRLSPSISAKVLQSLGERLSAAAL